MEVVVAALVVLDVGLDRLGKPPGPDGQFVLAVPDRAHRRREPDVELTSTRPSSDEMERPGPLPAVDIPKDRRHHIMRRRTETVPVAQIPKALEEITGVELDGGARRDDDTLRSAPDPHLPRPPQGHLDLALERRRAVVHRVDHEPVAPFVRQVKRHRRQGPPQIMPCRLGNARSIHDAPARTRPKIAQKPHQAPTGHRASPTPFAERRRHHLAGGDPPERQIAVVVAIAERHGIDPKQARQIVIANVVEVPAGAEVAGRSGLPGGVVHFH